MLKHIVIAILFSTSFSTWGMKPTVSARFEKDSIKIGEPVKLTIVVKGRIDTEFIFADTTEDIFPFEIISLEKFNTSVHDSLTTDSLIAHIRTFEVKDQLRVQFPIYGLINGDTSKIYSNQAIIFLKKTVKNIPQPIQLKENTTYIPLTPKFNYPFWILIGIVIIVLVALFFIFFLTPLRKRFIVKKRQQKHENFIHQFEKLQSEQQYTELLKMWKLYISTLNQFPDFDSKTTQEIKTFITNQSLISTLEQFDAIIYGGKTAVPDLNPLLELTNEHFQQVMNSLKNGVSQK